MFKDKEFHYIILDESQRIKNPLSKTAKEIYGLKSRHKLAMTGTPIENNSLELWSQFAFLNPGLLGNIAYFKETFAKSIEKEKDEYKTNALKNIINPFLLMRKKEMVAKDLPEKQISVSCCEMEPKQREIYDSWKAKIKSEIETAIKEEGFMKSRFKILQGLMKLRQICNHPMLIDESFTGESGKLNMLMDQIEEVIAGGHKVLVFSSFVKMLHVFRSEFERKGIKFSYLDGSTRMSDRKHVVEQFQNDPDIKAFLISLKAGGLGLNLTEADYVFIVDPWWNPAAEMQAIDRTHRIGQKKNVFVYKAITKDSIEEKILQLQESKLDLVKNVIAVDEGLFKKLNRKDIEKLFV
jgi:non-specific serine/threonine protein kinase